MIIPSIVNSLRCIIGNCSKFKLIFLQQNNNQVLTTDHYFSRTKWRLLETKKLAAVNKENCEKHPRNNMAQNSNVPRSQEDYITQVSEKIEGRVTKKLSQEFSRTENRILGALARLDDFRMNPLLQGHSGTTPEASRNALSTNQGTNEDDPQNDPHPETGFFHSQMMQNSGPEDGHDSGTVYFLKNEAKRGLIIENLVNSTLLE